MDQNLLALLIAAIAASPGIFSLWRQYKTDQKTLPQTLATEGLKASETALAVVKQYTEEIQKVTNQFREVKDLADLLTDKLEKQSQIIDEMSVGIKKLCEQISLLGHIPTWEPDLLLKQAEELKNKKKEDRK